MGSNESLENLLRSGALKAEAPDRRECEGLLRSAVLRLQGYRSDHHDLVFQCLPHTVNLGRVQVRLFALCHEQRNLAEYEGYMGVDEGLLAELVGACLELLEKVRLEMA